MGARVVLTGVVGSGLRAVACNGWVLAPFVGGMVGGTMVVGMPTRVRGQLPNRATVDAVSKVAHQLQDLG